MFAQKGATGTWRGRPHLRRLAEQTSNVRPQARKKVPCGNGPCKPDRHSAFDAFRFSSPTTSVDVEFGEHLSGDEAYDDRAEHVYLPYQNCQRPHDTAFL